MARTTLPVFAHKKTEVAWDGSAKKTATERANEAAAKRESEVRGLLDEIVGMYAPGGDFGAGYEAELARTKTQDLARGTQALISSGLYGTTMAAGLGTAWEEAVGAPSRLKLEDVRTQRYAEALGQKAGFIERIEDVSPSFELMAGLEQQAAAVPKQSLEDWLSETFGGGGGGPAAPRTTPSYQAPTARRAAPTAYEPPAQQHEFIDPSKKTTKPKTEPKIDLSYLYVPEYAEKQLKKATKTAKRKISEDVYSGFNISDWM